jgi:transporter family protein
LALYSLINFILVAFEFNNAINTDFKSIILIFVKSIIIFFAWLLSFIAIRGLPISIITPFGTLAPVFTILFGVLILNEQIVFLQAVGIIVILTVYYFIGRIGTVEVEGLFKNKYLYLMIASTFLSSISAIIDKFSLKTVNVGQMQFWFNLFISLLFAATLIFNRVRNRDKQPFKISFFIILMSIFLVLSDRIYFSAVKMPSSEISIIMPLRRISIFVSAIIGGFIFKEKNLKKKFICACLIILGIALVFAGK